MTSVDRRRTGHRGRGLLSLRAGLFAGQSVERLERRAELGADLDDVLLEAPLLGGRLAGDAPRLRVRLLDDEVGLAAGLLLHVLGGALGRHERRAEERLELAVLRGLGLELLEPVGEVGALAPHLLEAVGDLVEQLVDGLPAVPAKPRPLSSTCLISTGVSGI